MAKTKQPRTLARATGKDHHMAQQSHDILMQAALVVARKRLAEGGISVGAGAGQRRSDRQTWT